MKYQKIMNLLDNTQNQPSKFRTRNCVEINDESQAAYNNNNNNNNSNNNNEINNNIKYKMSMIRTNLCDFSDAYLLFKGTISVSNIAALGAAVNNTNKEMIFESCAPFSNCITKINNTQGENAEYIDIVLPMYNLIECSDAYSNTIGSLWQYYRDEPALDDNGNITDFHTNNNNSGSFKFKQQIAEKAANRGPKNVEIIVPLKYLSDFWRTLEMPLINCEICLQQSWPRKCFIVAGTAANQRPEFKVTDAKLYVPVVTLPTQDNVNWFKKS